MRPRERLAFAFLLFVRLLAAFMDLLGVLAIGYLATSIALFVSEGSDPNRVFSFSGLAIPAATIKILPLAVAVILVLFICKAALAIYLTRAMAVLLARVEARAARKIAETVLGDGLDSYRRMSREELLFATSFGASCAFTGLLNNVATIISEGFLFLILITTFFVIDPISTISVLIFFGLLAVIIQWTTGKRLAESSKHILENSIRANITLNDLANSFRELTVLDKKRIFFDKFEAARLASADHIGKQLFLSGMPRHIVETAVLIGVLAFGGLKLLTGELADAVATLGVFFTGSMRIMAAMLPWQAALVAIRGNLPQAQLAQRLLAETGPIDIADSNKSSAVQRTEKPARPGEIVFDRVSFRYESEKDEVLKGISFKIPPGSVVAFIGKSGAGKSTIADILLGLIDPSSGSVKIAGLSPKDYAKKYPGALSYVPQSPGMLSGTVADNVAVGELLSPESRARIFDVLAKSNLLESIDGLPLGLETTLGSNSDGLSGGQLQRLGLARALYTNPNILLIDEGTSALDAKSEHEITQSISALRGKTTVILIAHRLNTVQHADIVFLVDEGCLIDQGTFQEIVKKNPSVAEAVNLMSIYLESPPA